MVVSRELLVFLLNFLFVTVAGWVLEDKVGKTWTKHDCNDCRRRYWALVSSRE